jgi:NADPH:quinone reductase-like Zn-dependent oxidoreductase
MYGTLLAKFGIGAKQVVGITSTKNVDTVRALGADHVVDYRNEDEMAKLQAGGHGKFDLIYDTVTSFAPEDPDYEPILRPLLKEDGQYVVIGPCVSALDRIRGFLDLVPWIGSGLTVSGVLQRPGYDWFFLLPTKRLAEKFSEYFGSGKIPASSILIDGVHMVETSADMLTAMERMKSRRTTGKIVVKMVQPGLEVSRKSTEPMYVADEEL